MYTISVGRRNKMILIFDISKTNARFILPQIYRTSEDSWNLAWYKFQIGWRLTKWKH